MPGGEDELGFYRTGEANRMRHTIARKVIAVAMSASMVLSGIPAEAFAAVAPTSGAGVTSTQTTDAGTDDAEAVTTSE